MQARFVNIVAGNTEYGFTSQLVRFNLIGAGKGVEPRCCHRDKGNTGCTELGTTAAATATRQNAFQPILATLENFFQSGGC